MSPLTDVIFSSQRRYVRRIHAIFNEVIFSFSGFRKTIPSRTLSLRCIGGTVPRGSLRSARVGAKALAQWVLDRDPPAQGGAVSRPVWGASAKCGLGSGIGCGPDEVPRRNAVAFYWGLRTLAPLARPFRRQREVNFSLEHFLPQSPLT